MAAGIALQALRPPRKRINLLGGKRERGTLAVSNKRAEEVSQNTRRNLFIFLTAPHAPKSASRAECLFISISKNNISAKDTPAPRGGKLRDLGFYHLKHKS
ncbi:hypothetical protein QQF64_019825 [Cirrhinus molitorella]|uniref:Uncharacterized protein n=1 Tax=Cirrhinus molitorella TaxID=172907 RepID=A0ABR3LJX4_9TELE